jgi:16S rRNA processing protein RimM
VNTSDLQLVAVGMIVKGFGIRGHVVVQPMTDMPARFARLKAVWMGRDTHTVTRCGIELAVVEPRGIRLKLDGIDDRTAADTLRGMLLFVEETEAIRLPKGHVFVHELLGMFVHDEEGHSLGTVADVLKYPANDVYVVRDGMREILIPAVKEFVRAIDVRTRTVTVHLIEGMAE